MSSVLRLLLMSVIAWIILFPMARARSTTAAQDCVRVDIVLWGDGRHDDTAALGAWLRGADAIWGQERRAGRRVDRRPQLSPVGRGLCPRRYRAAAGAVPHAVAGARRNRIRGPDRVGQRPGPGADHVRGQ